MVRKMHKGGRMMSQRYGLRVLKCSLREGYAMVHISVDGEKMNVPVHHMVLMAFGGPRPDGAFGLHNNGNSLDNRPSNLRWGTHNDNMADRKRHGNYAAGERHPRAKLTNDQVDSIRQRNLSCKQIVNEFGISRTQAYRIISGQSRAS